jgi:predicted branched-subunit amino acid permease
MNSHSQAIWQAQTPRELQGQVFAVRRLIAQFTWPFSTALAGLLGGLFNPGAVVAVLGEFLTVFCIAQIFNRYLLRVEDKAALDAMAAKVTSGEGMLLATCGLRLVTRHSSLVTPRDCAIA